MSLEYWTWRFLQNPSDAPKILLSWDEDTLVAHYSVSPVTLSVEGEDYSSALSMTTMTAPDYRGLGLFPSMAAQLYDELAQAHYVAVWGFPNYSSHRGFINHLGWKDIYEIPMKILEISSAKTDRFPNKVVELDNFDIRVDRLWRQASRHHHTMVKRDSRYLEWRFTNNPATNYRFFGYFEKGSLLGYAVTSVYREDELQVVDMLALPDNQIMLELWSRIIEDAKATNMKLVKMWLPVHSPFHQNLERLGFRNAAPVTYFGARQLINLSGIDVTHPRTWHYSMSDSDNF